MHSVLLIDDHDIVRFGITALFSNTEEFQVIGQAASIGEAEVLISRLKPDLVISDLSLPDSKGLATVRGVVAAQSPRSTLFLSMHDEIIYAEQVLACGAKGYMMKEKAQNHILEAARIIVEGGVWVSAAVSSSLLHRIVSSGKAIQKNTPMPLSARETEILSMLGSGKSTKEIAHSLELSPRTVDAHRARIKQKLGVKSIAELIVYAASAGS